MEKRLVDANELKEDLVDALDAIKETREAKDRMIIDAVIFAVCNAIDRAETVDNVSLGAYRQVAWERDIAMSYLEEAGISFGEKAEMQRVKHGKWFLLDDCSNHGVYCSVCHKKVYKDEYANQKLKSKYCPNCGARMGGD